jgi:cytohesin
MNNSWETALVYAASHGNDGCVQALLDHEAAFQTLPMVDAAVSSDATVLRRFLLMGGDPNATDSQGTTPLMETSYWGNVEVVAVLLAHGADTGIKSSGGHSVFDATEKWDCTPEARDKILSLLREASGKEP